MSYKDFPKWQGVVSGKNLIFDTDVIVSVIAFEAGELMDELKKLRVTFNYINPVLLELMNTENGADKLKRNKLLTDYNFLELPMTATEIAHANRIQASFPLGIKGRPSPTDYYLGGFLARYDNGNTLLLTSNVKDFPLPIFTREAFIPLINATDFKAISIIGLDSAQLIEEH
jgi:hypothetical protein